MDGIVVGQCCLWKPTSGGLGAVVTVQQIDLARERVLIHLLKRFTGLCGVHWVGLETLSPAPLDAQPCGCQMGPKPAQDGHEAA